MKVSITGVLTSLEVKTKEEKTTTDLFIAQSGEQKQIKDRLDGDKSKDFKLFSEYTLHGKVVMYNTSSGIGSLIKG
jgi:hypothetical protein